MEKRREERRTGRPEAGSLHRNLAWLLRKAGEGYEVGAAGSSLSCPFFFCSLNKNKPAHPAQVVGQRGWLGSWKTAGPTFPGLGDGS